MTGATGIKVLVGAVPDDEERLLANIEAEIAVNSAHHGYMLEVWKSQAQVAWFRGRCQEAVEIIEAAIERARELNDRLLYNLHFQRAEFDRLTGASESASAGYARVLEFGEGNRDRNLVSSAILGLVLADISAGT